MEVLRIGGINRSLTLLSKQVPHVGIFWLLRGAGRASVLICDATPLREAEPYGDCLGHPGGHFEVWEGWRRLGARGLAKLGLPSCIVNHEYEDFPRGRIVYQCDERRFIVYADPRLHAPVHRAAISSRFGLDASTVHFALDAHYRRI